MTRHEAEQKIHAEAVRIWTGENFLGAKSDAQRIASQALGFTPDLFPEVEAGEAFRSYAGELFA